MAETFKEFMAGESRLPIDETPQKVITNSGLAFLLDRQGVPVQIPVDDAPALLGQGYTPQNIDQYHAFKVKESEKASASPYGAFAREALGSATLGLTSLIQDEELTEHYRKEFPKASMAGNIAGALMPGTPLARAAKGAATLATKGVQGALGAGKLGNLASIPASGAAMALPIVAGQSLQEGELDSDKISSAPLWGAGINLGLAGLGGIGKLALGASRLPGKALGGGNKLSKLESQLSDDIATHLKGDVRESLNAAKEKRSLADAILEQSKVHESKALSKQSDALRREADMILDDLNKIPTSSGTKVSELEQRLSTVTEKIESMTALSERISEPSKG